MMAKSLKNILIVLVAWGTINSFSTANANEELRGTMRRTAKTIKETLAPRGVTTVVLGTFNGPPAYASSAGVGLRKLLAEELKKLDMQVKQLGAAVAIQAKFRPVKKQGFAAIKITITIEDQNGEPISRFDRKVTTEDSFLQTTTEVNNGQFSIDDDIDPAPLGTLIGTNVDLTPSPDGDFVTGDDVLDTMNHPTAFIKDGTEVKASRNSLFSLQVYVNGKPRAAKLVDGHPFVELTKNDVFELRLNNYAKFDVAAMFHLDGVNSFGMSNMRKTTKYGKGDPLYKRWIIPKRSRHDLKGWHKDNNHVRAFKIVDFSDSVASELGSTNALGTISVSVQATWKMSEQPPAGEPQRARAVAIDPNIGVGQGNVKSQKVKENVDPREYGIPRAVISIRYVKP